MNYLAHVFLAPTSTQAQLGSLYADFVRGTLARLAQNFSTPVIRGIALHRKIDHYTDHHPLLLQSRQLFSSARRRYSGIMLDVLYDHFLSRHWSVYTDQPKRQFIDGIYLLLEQNIQMLPPKLAEIAPGMIANDWLGSYEDIDVIGVVYDRISIRIKRENTMSGGLEEVSAHYAELEQHFLSFFPLVMNYADELNQRSFPANAG